MKKINLRGFVKCTFFFIAVANIFAWILSGIGIAVNIGEGNYSIVWLCIAMIIFFVVVSFFMLWYYGLRFVIAIEESEEPIVRTFLRSYAIDRINVSVEDELGKYVIRFPVGGKRKTCVAYKHFFCPGKKLFTQEEINILLLIPKL